MSLSKKNYEAVAELLRTQVIPGPDESVEEQTWNDAVEVIASDLAGYFAADNPRFDRGRFLKACGL